MKRIVALCLSLAMALSLGACSSNNPSPNASAPGSNGSSQASPAETIEFSYCYQNTNGFYYTALDLFAETLEEISDGRFVGTRYTPGTMGNESELCDAVAIGDITFTLPSDTVMLLALGLPDWESIPGLVSSREEAQAEVLSADGWFAQLLAKTLAENGVVRLAGFDKGFRMIAHQGALDTPESLRGLKLRTGSAWATVTMYGGLGCLPTVVDSSEVLTAYQQGTVNAIDNTMTALASQGFIDLCDSVLAINRIYSCASLMCNGDWYNSLSADDQALVEQAAQVAYEYGLEEAQKEYDKYVNDPRWTIYELSAEQEAVVDEVVAEMWTEADEMYPEVMAALREHKK